MSVPSFLRPVPNFASISDDARYSTVRAPVTRARLVRPSHRKWVVGNGQQSVLNHLTIICYPRLRKAHGMRLSFSDQAIEIKS